MRKVWARIAQKLSEFLLSALDNHPGKLLGALCGFLLGIMIIIFGFWHTLMLIILVAIGIVVGKYWDEDKKFWRWIDRLK